MSFFVKVPLMWKIFWSRVINFTHNSQIWSNMPCQLFWGIFSVFAAHFFCFAQQSWQLMQHHWYMNKSDFSLTSWMQYLFVVSFFIFVWLWISKQIQFCYCFLKCGHRVSMSDVSQTCESRFVYVSATLSLSYGLFKIQCRLRKLHICYCRWGNIRGLNKDLFFSLIRVVSIH
jgi:hypothetical protein